MGAEMKHGNTISLGYLIMKNDKMSKVPKVGPAGLVDAPKGPTRLGEVK